MSVHFSNIRPISDLRTDLSDICDELALSQDPIFLTKNGRPTLVMMGCDAFEKRTASSNSQGQTSSDQKDATSVSSSSSVSNPSLALGSSPAPSPSQVHASTASSPKPPVSSYYGCKVFDDQTMQQRLGANTYKSFKATIEAGASLSFDVANSLAIAMKNWAIEQGATHYTHWFQPLSGITSEKHDAFISPQPEGKALESFHVQELIQSEPDASSFPNGGLRATFEARGYTAWDPTSYAFIKDQVLCIPTVFCSYTGEALDKKTPLLRSINALSQQVQRVLKLFGNKEEVVKVMCGPEQEYFLIRKEEYAARQDLQITGRTLFGAAPCKGQELSEHYFGALRHTVLEYMKEVDEELWKLGIPAKTRHNEVAPCQHELAIVYADVNRAVEYNLLTMEVMRKVAARHDMVCLQHEKPFAGINGSGKHVNWSISAGDQNLLKPGEDPLDKLRFMIMLTAIIQGVDEYQGLLRASVATAGNDHRLGAHEAPPAIVSIFLGDDLTAMVEALINHQDFVSLEAASLDLGVATLPALLQDNTDRNRTSPFAFTGNKFEFRMPGSSINVADANTVLNTAVAKALADYLDAVEDAVLQGGNLAELSYSYLRTTLKTHKRIIFNGDGYSDAWRKEAQARGLLNLASTVDALPEMVTEESIELFTRMGVLDKAEMESRYEVALEQYAKILNIEGKTMSHMTRRKIVPAVTAYAGIVASTLVQKKIACPDMSCSADEKLLRKLNEGINSISSYTEELDTAIEHAQHLQVQEDMLAAARAYHDGVLAAMTKLRNVVDNMEEIVSTECWPIPTYNKILFY